MDEVGGSLEGTESYEGFESEAVTVDSFPDMPSASDVSFEGTEGLAEANGDTLTWEQVESFPDMEPSEPIAETAVEQGLAEVPEDSAITDEGASDASGMRSPFDETRFEKELTNEPEFSGEMCPPLPADTSGWDELKDVPFAGDAPEGVGTGVELSEGVGAIGDSFEQSDVTEAPMENIGDVGS